MLDLLKDLEQAGSWHDMRREFGLFLGLEAPIPGSVLRRAREDDRFAAWLIMSRNKTDLLGVLIDDSRNIHFSKPEDLEQVSPLALAGKAGKALLKWGRGGFQSVPAETLRERIDTCETCPWLVEAPDFSVYKVKFSDKADHRVCSACGCMMSRKAQLATENCPVGRWGAVETEGRGEEL